MSFCRQRFNLYFVPAALLLLVSGCSMFHHKKEQMAILRIHLESQSSAMSNTKSVNVLRSEPVVVNVSTDPLLTEADVVSARLLDSPGGFAVELKFQEQAGWRLEQASAINPGKHLAIFAQWSDKPADGRWLAAPLIVRRNGTAALDFTPDATHEEMEKWVKGLNDLAKKTAEEGGMKSNP